MFYKVRSYYDKVASHSYCHCLFMSGWTVVLLQTFSGLPQRGPYTWPSRCVLQRSTTPGGGRLSFPSDVKPHHTAPSGQRVASGGSKASQDWTGALRTAAWCHHLSCASFYHENDMGL